MEHFPFIETQVDFLKSISKELGVNIYVKRDDVFQLAGGGNKARKLQYILFKAQKENYDAIVTAGDINSNHNRATAIMCAKLGMKCKLIVHNEHPENEVYSRNMFLSRLCGAEIIYCKKEDVSSTMDNAMEDFIKKEQNPFYIWGGGHCLEGSYAYYDAVKNLKEEFTQHFDKVYFASGTGTTHAGIHVGLKIHYPHSKAIGISIARDKSRGITEIRKSIIELENYLKLENKSNYDSIIFDDNYVGKGYDTSNVEIDILIKKIATSDGLILDPTYSGKAFYGMLDQIKNNQVTKDNNILFWNTGGIFNLLSYK